MPHQERLLLQVSKLISALQALIKEGKLALLQRMYKEWPFFSVTLDMIEMVFAKADPRVAQVCFCTPLLASHTINLDSTATAVEGYEPNLRGISLEPLLLGTSITAITFLRLMPSSC